MSDGGVGCLGIVGMFIVEALAFGGHPLWNWLHYTGSVVVCVLTLGRVWLSDRHEVLAGLIGLALYAAIITWAIPYFLAYGERP